jgi:hypothetical protein
MSNPLSSLLCLPTEIRLEIYAYLLPTNKSINIIPNPTCTLGSHALPNRYLISYFWNDSRRYAVDPSQKDLAVTLPLLSVCKIVYAEACSVLYGKNDFTFSMGHLPFATSLSGDNEIFGDGFSAAIAPGVAKWMRHVGIDVRIMDSGFVGSKRKGKKMCAESGRDYSRIRAWMERLERTFGNAEQRSLVSLSVTCVKGTFEGRDYIGGQILTFTPRERRDGPSVERGNFLEPLSGIRGLRSVTIEGVDDVFKERLVNVMLGSESRTLKRKSYATTIYQKKVMKRRKGMDKKATLEIVRSEKKFYDPIFNWDDIELERVQ